MKHVILSRRPSSKNKPDVVSPIPPHAEPDKEKSKPTPAQSKPVRKKAQTLPVTLVLVNFKTKRLTHTALQTFRSHYPSVECIVVDNGSADESTDYIRRLNGKHITTILHDTNLGHGIAMHQAICSVTTPYFFTMDSDCEVIQSGFLQKMIQRMEQRPQLYALGWKRWVDRMSGVPLEWHLNKQPSDKFVAYAHPAASLYRVDIYRKLRPFFHHGAPCLQNMVDAADKGYLVESFPIFDYVHHLEAGTRRMYQGRWNPKTEETPDPWNEKRRFPI